MSAQAGYSGYADIVQSVHRKILIKRIDLNAYHYGYPPTDKGSTSQCTYYEGRGDPQALPQECAPIGATPSITDETDLSRKRKSVPAGDVSLD